MNEFIRTNRNIQVCLEESAWWCWTLRDESFRHFAIGGVYVDVDCLYGI